MNHFYLSLFLPVALLAGCATSNNASNTVTFQPQKANYSKAYEEYLNLGKIYLQQGHYNLAEPKLKHAIELDSRPPDAWNALAILYEEKRDIAEGYQVYEKLIASHPNYLLGWRNFATFLCKFNRDKELQGLYQRMRAKGSDFKGGSYVSEGDCAMSRGQDGKAQAAYQQALTMNPQAPGALLPLAQLAMKRNDFAAAMRYLKVIHTYIGYSPESVDLAIKAARGMGDNAAEQELLRIMRANYANSPQAKALGI